MGSAKLLITKPIVRKMDSSRHGLVPPVMLCCERLARNVGITDST